MKKFKIFLWIILVALIAHVFFQNREFFTAKHLFTFDLYFTEPYHSPELPIAVWFLAVFCVGLLVAYFFGLIEKFKANKTIKGLNAKIATQMEMITQLRTELESHLNPIQPPEAQTASEDTDSEKPAIPLSSED